MSDGHGIAAGTVTGARDWEAFIAANTRLLRPPLVPEIVLHLAEESLPIWRKTEEELGEMNVPPPFWAFAWAGGQALARYVLDRPELVAGRRVVDIGTGSGLSAIAAAKAGAAHVLANDPDAIAVAATEMNARENGVTLDTSTEDLLDRADIPFDVVFMADVFYEQPLAERGAAFAARAISRGAAVLIGDPKRNFLPVARLEPLAEYQVPVTRELEDNEIKHTSVWRFTA